MLETIHISLYKSNNKKAFEKYNKAYSKIIEEFGENYTAFSEDWYVRPNTYCCIISNEKNEAIGGYRLQIHQPNYKLPIQSKSIKYKSKIDSFIRNQNYFELCESNGFFVISKYRKTLISYEIVRSSLLFAMQLNIKTMLGITLEQTTKIFNHFNIAVNKEIMSPDNYFLFANNPKSFVFEITNLTAQIKKGIETREDSHILKEMLENKKTSYKLKHKHREYEFNFENHIN